VKKQERSLPVGPEGCPRHAPADALPGGYYRLTRPNADMTLILKSLGVDADLRLYVQYFKNG
jgi:hypothetical protein